MTSLTHLETGIQIQLKPARKVIGPGNVKTIPKRRLNLQYYICHLRNLLRKNNVIAEFLVQIIGEKIKSLMTKCKIANPKWLEPNGQNQNG